MAAPASASMVNPFGSRLRHWRRLRGMSQLTLATEAATTARHVSFPEIIAQRCGLVDATNPCRCARSRAASTAGSSTATT